MNQMKQRRIPNEWPVHRLINNGVYGLSAELKVVLEQDEMFLENLDD